jgi:hypothetical protein
MEDFNKPSSVSDCFHIYSNGKKVITLFPEREDCIFMMNMLAVTSYYCNVRILVMQIMETHFHIIASGSVDECYRFKGDLLMKISKYLNRDGRKAYSIAKFQISMDPINDVTELKNKFMYVYRNGLSAGFHYVPWHYEWGPGDIYFVNHAELEKVGTPLRALPNTEQRRIFHSNKLMPQDWRFNDEGMIMPHSYVDWRRVEKEFFSPKTFVAFLYQKKDIMMNLNTELARKQIYELSEREVKMLAKEYCINMFCHGLKEASIKERLEVAKRLWLERRTYSKSVIARATLLKHEVVNAVLA